MSAAETLYTPRIPYPDVVERARQQVVTLEVYRDGSIVAPTEAGSTLTIYKPDGTKLVDAAAVTVTSSIARYTLTAGVLPTTLDIGEGYLQVWSLVMPDGVTHTYHREMAIAVRALFPVVAVEDLEAEYPALATLFRGEGLSIQGFLDEAWKRLIRKLIGKGILTYRVVSTESTSDAHRELALYLVFKHAYQMQGAASSNRWQQLYETHLANYRAALAEMNFTEDADGDGLADSSSRRNPGTVVHLNAAPRTRLVRTAKW
jgi:hypothetical protein